MQTHRSAPRGRAAAMSILRPSRDRSAPPAAAPPACPSPHHCFAHSSPTPVFSPTAGAAQLPSGGARCPQEGGARRKAGALCGRAGTRCARSPSSLVLGDIPAFFSATNSMQTQRETQLSLGLETWLCEEWKAFPL